MVDTTEWKAIRSQSDVLRFLRRALWLGSAGLVAIAATVAAFHVAQTKRDAWVLHTREVARLGRNARTYAVERVAGARALLLTGDLEALAPEVAAHRALGPTLDTLASLTRDNAAQQARVGVIRTELKAWEEGYLVPLLRQVAARGRNETVPTITEPTGNTLFEPVRSAFNEFVREEERLYVERAARARQLGWFMLAAVLTELVLLAAVLAWLMRRSLAQAHQIVEQQEKLEEDALEMEMQSAELQEQSVELEEQMQHAHDAAAELGRANEALRTSMDEREAAVSEVSAQRHFLRQVIDAIPHLVFAKDRTGRFTLVNQAVASVFGTTPDAVIGKSDADFGLPPEVVAKYRAEDHAVMDSLGTQVIPEDSFTDRTGKQRWLTTVKRALPNGDGRAHQVLAVSTDITDRRALEKQLLQAQKMEAVGQLAGGVAHDFNNLLTVITSYADLLLADLGESSAKADVEEIRRAADRASGLTRQLLAFSRKQVLQPTNLTPNGVVEGMHKMLGRLIGADVELATALADDVWTINADPGQLEQVIMNLVVNARDAMPDGGRITIETANVELGETEVAKGREIPAGSYVMLAVSDTGHGMGPDTLARIFEPFFTTKPQGQGTGLGLPTVFGIVRQSGGDVWVYSEVGQGTTFKVYLPRVTSSPKSVAEAVAMVSPRGAETVLIAEDDDALRVLARRVLVGQGYTVLEARNGREALEVCASHVGPIDLVLSDIIMPELGGKGLSEGIATSRPETRILLMSGYTDDDVLRRALVDRRTAFLQKPFTPVTLSKRVRDVLDAVAA